MPVAALDAVRWIGTISYSMYLVYMSVIVLFRRWPGSRFSAFFGALAVAILYSAACWYGFEKRLLNPKKNRIAPHAVSEPA